MTDTNDGMVWGWQSKIKTIAERGKHLLGTDILSDITFRVGPKDGEIVDIKAHKFLLAMGSTVFETMFYGNLPEITSIIPITDIDPQSFRILLRYIYHDQIGPLDDNTAFPTLYAAKKYGLPILQDACEGYVRANVTIHNCLAWFVQAKMYDEPKLAEFLLLTIDCQGPLLLESADFLEVDMGILKELLSRDSLKVREVDVYNAALKWAVHRCAREQIDGTGANLRAVLEDALFLIRFPIMTSQEVASGPAKLGMLLADEVNQLFQFWYASETLPGMFISTRRLISAELHIVRFAGRQDGWTYAAGKPNGIRLCITSVTDKTNRSVDLATINLVAVGIYLSSERPLHRYGAVCPNNCCLCKQPYSQHIGQQCPNGATEFHCACPPKPSVTITLRVYIEEGANQRELEEFRQTVCPPGGQTGHRVQKIAFDKAVPLKIQQRYTVSADITGIEHSHYGTEGSCSVTKATSSGDLNVAVQFSSVSQGDGNHAPGVSSGGQPFGITTVAQGQLPEFYFEVIG